MTFFKVLSLPSYSLKQHHHDAISVVDQHDILQGSERTKLLRLQIKEDSS